MTTPADLAARIARARETVANGKHRHCTVCVDAHFALSALPALLDVAEAAGELRDAFVTLNEYKEDADWGRCEDAQAVLDAALAKVKEVL